MSLGDDRGGGGRWQKQFDSSCGIGIGRGVTRREGGGGQCGRGGGRVTRREGGVQ